MIDFIRGKVVHVEGDHVVLDTGGIGYRIFCANPYDIAANGDEAVAFIHYHVRDDAHLLYGFANREEQRLFRKLLDVTGIGPKVALGILSGGRPEALVLAIRNEDTIYLSKLPGIGKKTAQRIILDLKDKLDDLYSGGFAAVGADHGEVATASQVGRGGPAWVEAKEGLIALGYKEVELDQAWSVISEQVEENAPVDQLMKLALKALYNG